MPQLRIIELECVKKQDIIGKDRVLVRVDTQQGSQKFGPFRMGKGDKEKFDFTRDFSNDVDIRLGELDGPVGGDNDENLGKITVKVNQAGEGILTGVFDKRKGTDYHLKYRVS
jgi:hypothetical protein